jgi:GTP cyclohydrolase I
MSSSSSLPDDPPTSEHMTVVTNSHTNSPVPSEIEGTVCRRAAGEICICDTCESARTRLMHRSNKKRGREQETGAVVTTTVEDSLVDNNNNINPATTCTVITTKSAKDTAIAAKEEQEAAEKEQQAKLNTMAAACKTILECIGEDPAREGLIKTPARWAKSLMFMCKGYHQTAQEVTGDAVFSENHDEMVIVRNIDIHSLCEHHMVPFTGRVHIGYIPNGKIIGLSKLARIAEMYARRLQVQERLTRQIADAIVETVEPLGVAVVVECTHFCMVMRGVQKTGAITTTSSVRGCFEKNPKTRAEFFSIIQGNGFKMC